MYGPMVKGVYLSKVKMGYIHDGSTSDIERMGLSFLPRIGDRSTSPYLVGLEVMLNWTRCSLEVVRVQILISSVGT